MKTEWEMYFKDDLTKEEAEKEGMMDHMFCERCGMCIDCKDCKCKVPL